MDNCPEFLLAWAACARIGAVAVTTNTGSSADEIACFVEHSRAVAAITQPKFATLIKENCHGLSWLAVTTTNSESAAEEAVTPGCDIFSDLFGHSSKF